MQINNLQSKRTAAAEPTHSDSKTASLEAKEPVTATNPEQPTAIEPEKAEAKVVELTDDAARLSLDDRTKQTEPAEESKDAPATAQTESKVDAGETPVAGLKRPLSQITPAAKEDADASKAEETPATKKDETIAPSKRLRVEPTEASAADAVKNKSEVKIVDQQPTAEEPAQIETSDASKAKKESQAMSKSTQAEAAKVADVTSLQDDTVSVPASKEDKKASNQVEMHEAPSVVKDIPLTEEQAEIFKKSGEKPLTPVVEQATPVLGDSEVPIVQKSQEQPKQPDSILEPKEAEKTAQQIDVEQAYLEAATAGDTNSANVQ